MWISCRVCLLRTRGRQLRLLKPFTNSYLFCHSLALFILLFPFLAPFLSTYNSPLSVYRQAYSGQTIALPPNGCRFDRSHWRWGKHLDHVFDPLQEHKQGGIHKLRLSGATKRPYRRSLPVDGGHHLETSTFHKRHSFRFDSPQCTSTRRKIYLGTTTLWRMCLQRNSHAQRFLLPVRLSLVWIAQLAHTASRLTSNSHGWHIRFTS